MIKIDPTFLIIIAEVVAGLVAILGAVLFVFIKRRKADKQAFAELEKRLKINSAKRQEVLEEGIALSCGGGEDNDEVAAENKEMAKNWCDKENAFYNRLVAMYMQRDSTALKSLDKLLHEHTSSHLDAISTIRERFDGEQSELSEGLGQQLEILEQNGQKLASEVENLKGENQRLSEELEKAYAEIDQAMHEYSRMAVTGSAGSKKAAAKEPEPIEEPVVPVLEDEVESGSVADIDALAAELEGFGGDDVVESEMDQLSELEVDLQAELEPIETETMPEQVGDVDEGEALVDMSMLEDIVAEPESVEIPDEVIDEVEPEEVEIPDEVIDEVEPEEVEIPDEIIDEVEPEEIEIPDEVIDEVEPEEVEIPDEIIDEVEPEEIEIPDEIIDEVEPEEVEIPDEVINEVEPEEVEIPDEVIDEVEPEEIEIPDEVIDEVEPEEVEIPDEVIDEVEPEEVEIPDEVIDEVEPEEVELPDVVVDEEESLEDVVLHAMAEESAAQQAEAVVEEQNPSMVIDLAKDDEIILSAPQEVAAEPELESQSEIQSIDESGINEDDLLAQLAEIENDDEFGSLEGFGELPEAAEDEDKKPAS